MPNMNISKVGHQDVSRAKRLGALARGSLANSKCQVLICCDVERPKKASGLPMGALDGIWRPLHGPNMNIPGVANQDVLPAGYVF